MKPASKITARRVEVFPGRLRIWVALAADAPRQASEGMVAAAYEAYPTLPLHSCINSRGPTFGDVAVGTSVPHLLEHVVIAEQVRLAAEAERLQADAAEAERPRNATFVGTTEWCEGGAARGEAIVEVSFVDDLQALEALSRALVFLGATLDRF